MQPLPPPTGNRNSILLNACFEHLPTLLLLFSVFVGGLICVGVGVDITTLQWLSELVVFVSFCVDVAAAPVSFSGLVLAGGCVGVVLFLFLLKVALGRAFLEGTPEKEQFFAESLEGVGVFAEAGWGLMLAAARQDKYMS